MMILIVIWILGIVIIAYLVKDVEIGFPELVDEVKKIKYICIALWLIWLLFFLFIMNLYAKQGLL